MDDQYAKKLIDAVNGIASALEDLARSQNHSRTALENISESLSPVYEYLGSISASLDTLQDTVRAWTEHTREARTTHTPEGDR